MNKFSFPSIFRTVEKHVNENCHLETANQSSRSILDTTGYLTYHSYLGNTKCLSDKINYLDFFFCLNTTVN